LAKADLKAPSKCHKLAEMGGEKLAASLRLSCPHGCAIFSMAFRQCEVVIQREDGRKYSAVITANSVYGAAALAFFDLCNNGPPQFNRPRVTANSRLEIRPIYRIEMRKVLEYADWADSLRDARRGANANQPLAVAIFSSQNLLVEDRAMQLFPCASWVQYFTS
jgi:hypothetical protein